MRMIDVDKFVLALMDASLSSVDEDTILDLVDSIHTVDAVPVVRCKDCRWHDIDYCMFYGFSCAKDHFCKSWAAKEKEPCKSIETIDANGLTATDRKRVAHLQIRPCPKCGSRAVLQCERLGMEPLPYYIVKCGWESVAAPRMTDTPEEAVELWNKYAACTGEKEEGEDG